MNKVELVEVKLHGSVVGRLGQTNSGLCAFEYDAEFLQAGVSISPFELPQKNGVMLAKRNPFGGNFGVFNDCLPDGWGMLILDRYLRKKGINLTKLSILDRLSIVGTSGRGALEFFPDQSSMNFSEVVDFNLLSAETQKMLESYDYQGEKLETLYQQGGSPGGARPKIFVKHDRKEWLVKFRASNDPQNTGEIEYNYSQLAGKCGIEMPETRLFEGKYFGVLRFDRTETGKIHVASAAGLLNADYRLPSLDYLNLFQLCQLLTRNMQEMWKLYRLMVFNFLIGNKDDHAKNFAFRQIEGEWTLSPAYDLLPSEGINGYRITSINNQIEPTMKDILGVAEKSGLKREKAVLIFDELEEIVRNNTPNP